MSARERATESLAFPPRAMRAETAAAYLSMSRSAFLRLVDEGKMPPAVKINKMSTWDRLDLDAAYEDFKYGNGGPSENTVLKSIREYDERKAAERRKGKA